MKKLNLKIAASSKASRHANRHRILAKIAVIAAIIAFGAAHDPAQAQTIERDLLFDKYTVADTFYYRKTERHIQWDKVKTALQNVEQMQAAKASWGVLQNKNNGNGEAPLVKEWHRDEYTRVADRNNLERYQSVPLYPPDDAKTPELYGRDGSPVKILATPDTLNRVLVEAVNTPGRWKVPAKYIKEIGTPDFSHVVMVDRTMQIVITLERQGEKWLVRSINPATTGAHNPPYQQPTPLGIHVIQEKKAKMLYTGDGNSKIAGYAPWASRFSSGGYVHGTPVNGVNAPTIEYGSTLGTVPRSHMCVRNATSHAKFVYDWAPALESLVVVIE